MNRKKIAIFLFLFIFVILGFFLINRDKNIDLKIGKENNSVKEIVPTATLSYDIMELTNQDVTVKLVNPNTEITIKNNDGKDFYTFTENGEFTFEFVDKYGNIGKETAVVDWIDKVPPIALISFDNNQDNTVTATLMDITEPITILNNNGNAIYTFYENGSFEFNYEDEAGNVGITIAKVNWLSSKNEYSKIEKDIFSNNIVENNIYDDYETNTHIEIEEETKKPTPKTEKEESAMAPNLEEDHEIENKFGKKYIYILGISCSLAFLFVFILKRIKKNI